MPSWHGAQLIKSTGTTFTLLFKYLLLATIYFRIFHIPSKSLEIKIYKNIILPVVLYWCETLCPTLRKEHRWRV